MAIDIYQHIQEGLVEKRQNVAEFLGTASEVEKDNCLCNDKHVVEEHFHVIDDSLFDIAEDGRVFELWQDGAVQELAAEARHDRKPPRFAMK